jgi:hypothetical protein
MSRLPGIPNEKFGLLLFGLAFIVVGFGATYLDWQIFFNEGVFRPRMAFFGPLLGFLGLAMLAGPATSEDEVMSNPSAERRRAQRQRLALFVFLAGVLLSALNFALMNGWIGGLTD